MGFGDGAHRRRARGPNLQIARLAFLTVKLPSQVPLSSPPPGALRRCLLVERVLPSRLAATRVPSIGNFSRCRSVPDNVGVKSRSAEVFGATALAGADYAKLTNMYARGQVFVMFHDVLS